MGTEALKVLIVDDQVGVRFLLETVVKEMGHKAYLAQNGLEAVRLANSVIPDMVLMDVRMPVMNGLDAMEKIKASIPEVKIVLMTAYSSEDTIEQALRKGALACLIKPFDVNYIRELLYSFKKEDCKGNASGAVYEDERPFKICNM